MARRILGLDLGSHAVKAVEFRQTLRGLEVAQLRTLPLDEPSPALASELRDFLQMHDLPTEHVVVSLAGDRVSTRRLSFPFRDRRKISPAVPFEVDAQVPFDLQDFFVDWEIIGQQGERTDVTATLAPRSEVALLLDTIREAGINPRTVEAEGLVLANLTSIFDLEGCIHWLRSRKVDNDLLAHRFHDSAPYSYIQAKSMPPLPLKKKCDKRW